MADNGIVLYDRTGQPQEFYGKKALRVPTTDGGTKDFVNATLTEKTVELDFSGGDMTIEPGADELFSKVSIPVPDGLLPGNIVEGVNVAGVIGTMVADAGAKIVVSSGTFTGLTADSPTVEHGLGVVPDIIILYTSDSYYASTSKLVMKQYVSFSSALKNVAATMISGFSKAIYTSAQYLGTVSSKRAYAVGTGRWTLGYDMDRLDPPSIAMTPVNYVDANSFSVLVSSSNTAVPVFESNLTYTWIAIGGLT